MDNDTAKKRLQSLLDELDAMTAELNAEQDPNKLPDVSDEDTEDAATELLSNDREVASLEVLAAQRQRVVDALRRLDDGSYGRCVDCGKALDDERLDARPEAARCLDDQRRVETAGVA